jgi:hypothetical protein
LPFLVLAGTILACGSSVALPTVDVSTIVAGTLQALVTPTAAPPPSQAVSAGVPISFANVGFVIPQGLATGSSSEAVPAVTDQAGPDWGRAPAYTRFTLQAYPLQGEFFEPQLMIYPAQEYAALSAGAAISIQRLQAILASPTASLANDVLPRLPFANAEQLIGAQPVVIDFEGGRGLRALVEYAQYSAPINNHELFYHFQGLTADAKYYVVGVLPVNLPYLAPNSDPAAILPPDSIPFPGTDVSDPALFTSYYQAVNNRLSATVPESFTPALTTLDSLIASLHVSP